MVNIQQQENESRGRFELKVDGEFVGELTYSWSGDVFFIIDHTLVIEKYRGNDYAKQLVMAAVDYAREKKVKIIPLCWYAKLVFDRDGSTSDVRK